MKVSVIGPESSGTRLLTRMIENLQVTVVHRSVPYGGEWWPDRDDDDADAYVVIVRDMEKTLLSQQRAGHLEAWSHLTPVEKYDCSVGLICRKMADVHPERVKMLRYETLVEDPQDTMDDIADWLCLPRRKVREKIDRNR